MSPQKRVVPARLFLGLIVLVCAEVFSGASIGMGLWHPWTWIVTYWLYFAHFFFFTSLAVYTKRTSLPSLYLWGVLYGLYEGWITKVIWHGYGGDGQLVMGSIGPFGASEITMVFFFHPVMSFILPLAIACVLYPTLRQTFPDLAWLTGNSVRARLTRGYLLISFIPIMIMNSGGLLHLAANYLFLFVLLYLASRWARSTTSPDSEQAIVVFARPGFLGLCLYLAMLYGMTYRFLRPDGIPSASVQLLTLGIYALAIAGLWLHPSREPVAEDETLVEPSESRLLKRLVFIMLAVALLGSPLAGASLISVPIMVNFAIWVVLGFCLLVLALSYGVRKSTRNLEPPHVAATSCNGT